jgi:hypothetical protein
MKITKSQLKKIIKEELGRVIEGGEEEIEYRPLGHVLGDALRDFVDETPALHTDERVAEAVRDYDWGFSDQFNGLYLGTIKGGGGDFLYDFIEEKGLLPALQAKMEQYVEERAKPTKRPRKLTIIPYTRYEWNEDEWGENL